MPEADTICRAGPSPGTSPPCLLQTIGCRCKQCTDANKACIAAFLTNFRALPATKANSTSVIVYSFLQRWQDERKLLVGEDGCGNVDDMGEAGVGREGEARWRGAGWHRGVVDRRRNLAKYISPQKYWAKFCHLVFVASRLVVFVQVALESKRLVAALALVVLE